MTDPDARPSVRRRPPLLARLCLGLACLITPLAAQASSGAATCGSPAEGMPGTPCTDQDLAALRAQLRQVEAEAGIDPSSDAASDSEACDAAPDPKTCLGDLIRKRIARLQIEQHQVTGFGPLTARCNDGSQFTATFFDTSPSAVQVTRDGTQTILWRAASGSGARYVLGQQSLWNKGNEAMVVWAKDAPTVDCRFPKG